MALTWPWDLSSLQMALAIESRHQVGCQSLITWLSSELFDQLRLSEPRAYSTTVSNLPSDLRSISISSTSSSKSHVYAKIRNSLLIAHEDLCLVLHVAQPPAIYFSDQLHLPSWSFVAYRHLEVDWICKVHPCHTLFPSTSSVLLGVKILSRGSKTSMFSLFPLTSRAPRLPIYLTILLKLLTSTSHDYKNSLKWCAKISGLL